MSEVVRAAGGVVHRARDDGTVEVLLIHRPKYGDWTLPKGKLEPGETDEQGALREVEEETGLRCEIEDAIGRVSYKDRKGRPKVVVYFAMRPVSGAFEPNDEVDELRWVTVDEAQGLLDYAHDRRLVARIAENPRL
ncbi:MAG: NUDIX hydrolase [Actinomycetota bacterium]